MQSALSDSHHEQCIGVLCIVGRQLPAAVGCGLLVFGMSEYMREASVQNPSHKSERGLNKPANLALLVPAPAKVWNS